MHISTRRSLSRNILATQVAVWAFITALLLAKWAGAEQVQPTGKQRCQVVYINGDAVIRCPKLVKVSR